VQQIHSGLHVIRSMVYNKLLLCIPLQNRTASITVHLLPANYRDVVHHSFQRTVLGHAVRYILCARISWRGIWKDARVGLHASTFPRSVRIPCLLIQQ